MFRVSRHLAAARGGRSGARRGFLIVSAGLIALALATPALARQQDPAVTVTETGGVYQVSARFTVPHAPSVAMSTLTDYAAIARFMPDVRSSTILERTGNRIVVEQEAVARFMMFSKRIHLVLDIEEQAGTIGFRDRCGKSFSHYEGRWTIGDDGGTSVVTYELTARPSFDVPEFLLKRLLKRDADRMIAALSAEIAARSQNARMKNSD